MGDGTLQTQGAAMLNSAEGRVDYLARNAFDALLAQHGNPMMMAARKAFEPEIVECLECECGPETSIGKWGSRIAALVQAYVHSKQGGGL